jgi:hypothetical protein
MSVAGTRRKMSLTWGACALELTVSALIQQLRSPADKIETVRLPADGFRRRVCAPGMSRPGNFVTRSYPYIRLQLG